MFFIGINSWVLRRQIYMKTLIQIINPIERKQNYY